MLCRLGKVLSFWVVQIPVITIRGDSLMKISIRMMAALVASLCLLAGSSAVAQQSNQQREYQIPEAAASDSGTQLAGYNSFDAGGFDSGDGCALNGCSCGSCDGSCSGSCGSDWGMGMMSRPGQFFLAGEYIYARANLSEALAYVVFDPNAPQNGAQFVEYDFDYKSSYRFSGGYRFCDCGGEIVFNFARYRGESDFSIQDTSASQNGVIFGPYEVNAPGADGFLTGEADIDLRSYDLGFSKTIPLGSPLGCCDSGCDSCCDDSCCDDSCYGTGCGCWCPAWDITWSAGIRHAEVDWSRSNLSLGSNGIDQIAFADTRLNWEGTGARVGLLGRRYVGKQGHMSIYAKGDLSLMVGDMDIQTITINDPDGSAPLNLVSHSNTGRRIIPVTEIEVGLTAHLGNHLNLTSGYFLSAWHDLGFRDEYNFTGPAGGGGGGFQLLNYDDANILGFDGYFARAEITY